MTAPKIDIPVKIGRVELRSASGRCVIDGCKIKGGGLLRVQHCSDSAEHLPDLAFQGKGLVVCGKHFLEVLTAVLTLPEDA